MPRTGKQLFLGNLTSQQQKWLMLLSYHSPDPREYKQIVSEYTHVLCKYILKLWATVLTLMKEQLLLDCSDLSRTRQLSAVIFSLHNNEQCIFYPYLYEST